MKLCLACNHENQDSAINCEDCNSPLDNSVGRDKTTIAEKSKTVFGKGDFIVDRYQVIEELGRGGMGVVYKVSDTLLNNRECALKMVHPALVANPEARKRFEDEVAICLDMHHPAIIQVYHMDRVGELLFFTMEYLSGKSLADLLIEKKGKVPPFSLEQLKAVMNPLLEGLSYAHQYTIHRDIKPDNIMVLGEFPDVTIKILDFGIARTMSTSRFTQTAQGLGTPYYMAPEQLEEAHEIDLRADLYSVGMVLYEMLTGEKAVGRFELPSELLTEEYKPFDQVIVKSLACKAERRYASVDELSDALVVAIAEIDQRREKKRLAEEKKRKEEEERKRAEEQKKKEEQFRKQAEMKKKRLAEEVARKKQEAELKEAERKQVAAAERRQEEKARKKSEEEQSRKEEERKKKAEEKQKQQETEREVAKKLALKQAEERKRKLRNAMVWGVICLGGVGGGWYALQDKSFGKSITDSTTGMEFVYIKKGCYQMGDTFGDGESDEKSVHKVCVDGFYMGRYEVTQGEYQKITGFNPSSFKKGSNYPVENVSWDDAQSFIRKLNSRSGKTFRLPTEAEWEYAAREKGKKVRFGTGKDTIGPDEANFDGDTEYKESYSRAGVYRMQITAVGSFSPNALGLHDMSGNVWEWCSDWYDETYYSSSSRNTPQGPSSGSHRVIRGGGWGTYPRYVRAADRSGGRPGYRYNYLGFRLVLSEGSK